MLTFVVKYLLIFFVGALIGYLIELFYRRFVSQKKWMNPGFLTGPYLPLYGFGVVTLYIICSLDFSSMDKMVEVLLKSLLILVMMTLIEYIAGLIFIKGMKIKLWDYSDRWGNIQGIICPLYSLFWGIIGFIYYMFIHPFINGIVDYWSANQILSFFVGAIFGIFVVDVFISFHLAAKIRSFAKKHDAVIHYETMKSTIKEFPGKLKDRLENASLAYKERIEKLNEEPKEEHYAFLGFVTSIVGFLAFPLGLCLVGLKAKKNRKYAIAGLVITIIELIALFVVAFVVMI